MTAPLSGRIALVTGASRGIGAAVARRLGAAGARMVLLARSEEALRTLAEEIGGGAVTLACDVRDRDKLFDELGRIPGLVGSAPDIVVNNAGAFMIAPVEETSLDELSEMLAVNLMAPFAVVLAVLKSMKDAGRGHIVNIGSVADRTTFAGNAAYASSKHGLRAIHEVLRAELRGSGVRVSLVSPSATDTELWDSIDPDNKPGFTPRSAMLTAEGVADTVYYAITAPAGVNVDEMRISRE